MNGGSLSKEAAQSARQAVLDRIARACNAAGRVPASVKLLAVGKTFGAPALLAMADAGQLAFGENYLQEALEKQRVVAHERPQLALEWHFIGPLQSNKTKPVAEHFDWVHTIDREKIASRLNDQRPAQAAPLNVCIQVNIDDEASKSGCSPARAIEIAGKIVAMPRLRLRGLMAIPRPTDDSSQQRESFAAVRAALDTLRQAIQQTHAPAAGALDTLSMGMTADLESAVAEGATVVRVGTALFGERRPRDQRHANPN